MGEAYSGQGIIAIGISDDSLLVLARQTYHICRVTGGRHEFANAQDILARWGCHSAVAFDAGSTVFMRTASRVYVENSSYKDRTSGTDFTIGVK